AGTHDLPNGASLFAFGDQDGRGNNARLQHCLGVSYADGKLYVADSYNNKIKTIDVATRDVTSLAGTREAGDLDDPPAFNEPDGLSAAGSTLYICDSNNHKVRVLNLTTKKVSSLDLSGVEAPKPPASKPRFPSPVVISVPADDAKVAPGKSFKLAV